jgi:hypothetical protein
MYREQPWSWPTQTSLLSWSRSCQKPSHYQSSNYCKNCSNDLTLSDSPNASMSMLKCRLPPHLDGTCCCAPLVVALAGAALSPKPPNPAPKLPKLRRVLSASDTWRCPGRMTGFSSCCRLRLSNFEVTADWGGEEGRFTGSEATGEEPMELGRLGPGALGFHSRPLLGAGNRKRNDVSRMKGGATRVLFDVMVHEFPCLLPRCQSAPRD